MAGDEKKSEEPLKVHKIKSGGETTKRKVVKRTVTRKKDSTAIFNSSELKGVLKDIVNPVNIAEDITGVNIVDELKGEKDNLIDRKKEPPKVKQTFVKEYLDNHQKMDRETFTGKTETISDEEELFGMSMKRGKTRSARNFEINARPF